MKNLMKINGETVKEFVRWLKEQNCGCCHFNIGNTDKYMMHICVGWHDYGDGDKADNYQHWVIAWKIGVENFNNGMQCDFDMDFFMPEDAQGNVYDTLQEIAGDDIDWDALAAEMNETAAEVYEWECNIEKPKVAEDYDDWAA